MSCRLFSGGKTAHFEYDNEVSPVLLQDDDTDIVGGKAVFGSLQGRRHIYILMMRCRLFFVLLWDDGTYLDVMRCHLFFCRTPTYSWMKSCRLFSFRTAIYMSSVFFQDDDTYPDGGRTSKAKGGAQLGKRTALHNSAVIS